MLSGGIDSGSVAAIAREIIRSRSDRPLHTFSATRTKDPECAESNAIRAAVAMPSISPTFVELEELGANFESLIAGNEEPFDGEGMMLKAIYLAAAEQGRSAILDGAGGDVVLSEGSYIVRLIRQGRLGLAMREITSENRRWRDSLLGPNLIQYAAAALLPDVFKRTVRGPRRRQQIKQYVDASLIAPEFARCVAIDERFDRMWQMFPAGWQPDYATERCNVIRPSVTAGRERYARLAATKAVEARDPFLDKRVVDFCSRLPGRFRLRDGWPKMILRELMAGQVPEDVRWLPGKPHLGWQFNVATTREAFTRGALSLPGTKKVLALYVDEVKLERAWRKFRGGGDVGQIHSAHVLSVWLQENATRPVVPD
jgi:asparagine synthase (glutamine-hydrolysing)